jgi:arginyl-tRNA synthetase
MSLDQMAERQKRQLEELDKLQSSLDALKRRAGGGSGSGTLVVTVSRIFEAAITAAFPDLVSALDKDQWLKINPTSDAKFGDYQCNSAMVIHKFLKDHGDTSCKAPRDVSTKILESMGQNEVLVKTEIAGPGFINAYLNPQWVAAQCAKILKDGPGVPSVETQNIVVDFSSPNIAKEMHVGHLRSTIIGESICRVLEFCGHRVSRINHVGDWGTQFGMLINHLRTAYPDFNEKPPNISDLTGFYKEAKKRFDEDEAFKKASQMAVVTLQSGDEFSLKCWNTLCAVSRIQFKMVYDRLECQGLVEQGESFYNSRIPPIVAELKGKGLIEESEGAQIIHCGRQIPLMAVKSDGGFGYDSTDDLVLLMCC